MQDQRLSTTLLLAAIVIPIASAQESVCPEHAVMKTHALLQKDMSSTRSTSKLGTEAKLATNPSGAAAPLNEGG